MKLHVYFVLGFHLCISLILFIVLGVYVLFADCRGSSSFDCQELPIIIFSGFLTSLLLTCAYLKKNQQIVNIWLYRIVNFLCLLCVGLFNLLIFANNLLFGLVLITASISLYKIKDKFLVFPRFILWILWAYIFITLFFIGLYVR
ncbi:MAG: hypothetical protein QG568_197 [Patescibacteria group bacterium]|nr:hypothetical protein [Patescibacteria group bacterium]